MRDIKFRAWDSKFGIMIPSAVVYDKDNIAVLDVTVNECYGDDIIDQRLDDIESPGPEWYLITGEVKPMQFTGSTALNGVDIYESDILTVYWDECGTDIPKDFKGVVKFIEGGFWVDNGQWAFRVWQEITVWEVIGNIYQNNELITKK